MYSLLEEIVTVLLTTDKVDLLARIWRETLYLGSKGQDVRDLIDKNALQLAKNCKLSRCDTFKEVVHNYDSRFVSDLLQQNYHNELLAYLRTTHGSTIPVKILNILYIYKFNSILCDVLMECLVRNDPLVMGKWRTVQHCVDFNGYLPYCVLLAKTRTVPRFLTKLLLSESKLSLAVLKSYKKKEAITLLQSFFSTDYNKTGIFTVNYPHIRDYLVTASLKVIASVLALGERKELKSLYRDMTNFIFTYNGSMEAVEALPYNSYFRSALKKLLILGKDIRNRKSLLLRLYEIESDHL